LSPEAAKLAVVDYARQALAFQRGEA